MGIRINKFMGYGLNDLAVDRDSGKVIDERINTDSFLISWEAECPPLSEYATYVRERDPYSIDISCLNNYAKGKFGRHEWRVPNLTDLIVVTDSESQHNVLCLRPLSCPDWRRHDDAIDYLENTGEDSLHMLGLRGLYPWSGSFIRMDTGEPVDQIIMSYVRLVNSDRPQQPALLDQLAMVGGFANHEEAQQLLTPLIPESIVDLCVFAKLFVDDKYINHLKPMIYTYWR